MLNLTLDNFDIGFKLDYVPSAFEPNILPNIDQYIDLRVSQNNYTWLTYPNGTVYFNKAKVRSSLVPCTIPRLGLTNDSVDYLNLQNGYWCP